MKSLVVTALSLLAVSALALSGNPNVRFASRKGAFPLIAKGKPAQVVVDPADWPGVARAANDLQADLTAVCGSPYASSGPSSKILIGTIGHSPLIDSLISEGRLDVRSIEGQWEANVSEVLDIPGKGDCLVIAGSDKRGTIYGIYDISEALGVSPWYWWADVPVKHHDNATITGRYEAKAPVVKYRGIFLNDEAPSLSNWVHETFGDYNHKFYEKVFELLLRLHANYLWPAMWNNAFSADDPLNAKLADEYGIVMGTSHVEPMMRADKEWGRAGFAEKQWNYATNPRELENFWRTGVQRNKPYENIVTIAMRGKVDTPMSETANIALLEKIVAAQRKILGEIINADVTQIPQLWCLYKEVQEYYEKGMRVPDDVTLLWADDNWGNIRRLPTPDERHRSGGAGVYYHFDYVGGPRNYKWIDTNPIPKIWEQMNLAHKYGADRIWIVNVGDLKPKPFATEFFLTMARDPDAIKKEDLVGYARRWAVREFGQVYADQIADIVMKTARLNGRRKPELVGPDTYSLLNYHEAERVSKEFNDLVKQAESLSKKLPGDCQDAFYEVVIHTIKAPQVLNDLYLAAARNALYAKQGRSSTNDQAQAVKTLFTEDAAVTAEYHSVHGGKWNHFMDQTHIGYTSWQQPDRNNMPKVAEIQVPAAANMGVAIEGSANVWPGARTQPKLEFTRFGASTRTMEIFNRGVQSFEYKVSTDAPWLFISKTSGAISDTTRQVEIKVEIDWTKVPTGQTDALITVSGAGSTVEISVSASVPSIFGNAPIGSFLEGDGVVAIESHHTSFRNDIAGVKWETIPGYGKTDSAIEAFPVEFKPFAPGKGPRVEYKLMTFTSGNAILELVVSPTLAFQPGRSLRVAVAFDDNPPQVIETATKYLSPDWEQSVIDSARHQISMHTLFPGPHILKIWAIDPGVVVQRVGLYFSEHKESNLGSPESLQAGDGGT